MSMEQVDDLQLELESYFDMKCREPLGVILIKIDSMLTAESFGI